MTVKKEEKFKTYIGAIGTAKSSEKDNYESDSEILARESLTELPIGWSYVS